MAAISSRKLLRIKVTPDLHLTYSKNGGNLGLVKLLLMTVLVVSEEKMFENVDIQNTYGRQRPTYTISSPISLKAQVG